MLAQDGPKGRSGWLDIRITLTGQLLAMTSIIDGNGSESGFLKPH